MTKEADIAMFVGCPKCKVDAGETCLDELGGVEPHAERVRYAYAHRAGSVYERHPAEPAEAICPFMRVGGSARELFFVASPMRVFKPEGLIIWGAPSDARVQLFVGMDLELATDVTPVPARWFAHYESFADIVKKLDAGEAPPSWGTWDPVRPGVHVRVLMTAKPRDGEPYRTRDFSADEIHAIDLLLWGHSPR